MPGSTDPIYESTDTIHIRISDVRSRQRSTANRLREELAGDQSRREEYNPLFLQLLESVYDGVLLTQLHGRIMQANTRACEFLQYSPEALSEINVIQLIAGATFEHLHTIYDSLSGERRLFIEAECVRADGSRFPADITVSLIQFNESEQLCFFIRNITTRKRTEEALHQAQEELVATAHRAGMAEIATNVLHDVGNLLNSVNISAELIRDAAHTEAEEALQLLATLLAEHAGDLPGFFSHDERGAQIPDFLQQIVDTLAADLATLQAEATNLKGKIATINDSITTQQEYAKSGLFMEEVSLPAIIEDAIALQKASIVRHQLQIRRSYAKVPTISIQKSKLIHVIVNLLTNAKDALLDNAPDQRLIDIELGLDSGYVICRLADNGSGIAPENLSRIFTHGFSTKPSGHGFGLHASANFMAEMGGSIAADSDGLGKGAAFTLSFPLEMDGDGEAAP